MKILDYIFSCLWIILISEIQKLFVFRAKGRIQDVPLEWIKLVFAAAHGNSYKVEFPRLVNSA